MPIDSLPEELLLSIFSHFDTSSPSELKSRQEPSLNLTQSDVHPLKDISLVSHRWRRIVLSLLFRYTRFHLKTPTNRPSCSLCTSTFLLPSDHEPVVHTSESARFFHARINQESKTWYHSDDTAPAIQDLPWINYVYHALTSLLSFISNRGLALHVYSFAVCSPRLLHLAQLGHGLAEEDPRYRVTTAFWRVVFEVLVPSRVVVLAPPGDLGIWTGLGGVALETTWAYTDMEYHLLELIVEDDDTVEGDGGDVVARTGEESFDERGVLRHNGAYGSDKTTILRMRPWTHLSLNEGSFLGAYATGEYMQQEGPPSALAAICGHISQDPHIRKNVSGPDMPSLHSFTYTAILPFASHFHFQPILPHITSLDIKLAPDPDSGILHDPARVSKAVQLGDCWREFFASYESITTPLRTAQLGVSAGKASAPTVTRFVCRDVSIPGLTLELDDEFTPLCLPCWAEVEPGVFERVAMVPPVYHEW
ncbi:unnamed protein product [Zymoseptoria tritici ST99CH_1E4]|uniref:F-box domain-containing protein n=1 Tax=Zymoseptoria tritici ST99CH_1E4 TaxID=1276532 RepID=A0A2H1FMC6_ZYMTR|nr:unnamed protein product [Zymoseptoria tritici ST99CH_1E4]